MKNKVFILLFSICFLVGFSAPIKVKVIVDNSSLKAAPEIEAKTLTKIPLNTILEAEEKQGEWYRVSVNQDGLKLSGFIHEMLVKVVPVEGEPSVEETNPAAGEKTQAEIAAEIALKIEEYRNLIRQDGKYEEALDSLLPLIAKVFNVTNQKRQKELAAEIFLLRGLAQAGRGEEVAARKEFRNIFEVSPDLARDFQKSVFDPKVLVIFQQAEKEFLGLSIEFSLAISSEPGGAKIKIDGKEIGVTPTIYKTTFSKIILEMDKEGYKPVREEILLTKPQDNKDYKLEPSVATLTLTSRPDKAKVYLDGKDTGETTDCQLIGVPFGSHQIKLIKDGFLEWHAEIELQEGKAPEPLTAELVGVSYIYSNKWGDLKDPLLEKPTGVVIDKENRVLVVDESDVKFKIFSPEGSVLSRGAPEAKDLKAPGAIALDSQGNIYIPDYKRDSVFKLDSKGKFLARWGKPRLGAPQEFSGPIGIAVDQNDFIYVADTGNSRIKKYTPEGALIKFWGKKGSGSGEFVSPRAVAVDQKGRLFILDSLRVQIFSSEGEPIGLWSVSGKELGVWNNPMGIFIDRNNCVYIADSGNNRIQKFDENGKLIAAWGVTGAENGQMNFPCGVAVDSRGTVYVVERNNNRVQLFIAGTAKS
jgi:DNA-binding beta-propeller fold protein YncE